MAEHPRSFLPRKSPRQALLRNREGDPSTGRRRPGSYQIPQRFRDAKFGIWAHWDRQSAAEDADWYARNIYIQDSPQYRTTWRDSGILRSSATKISARSGRPTSSMPIT